MTPDWLSAHLDDELGSDERAVVDAALEADAELRAEYDSLARVRAVLRAATVELPDGAIERVVAHVEAAPTVAPVVPIRARRRIPSLAAAAAAIVIIASVVGGVGGGTAVPALGELVERHQAAAVEADDFMADSVEMPMEKAAGMGPAMPPDYAMQHAFVDGRTLHFVYLTSDGAPVSVFRQDGEADLGRLPGGEMARVGSHDMWSSTHGSAYVVVIDGTGFFWTVVAAEPHDAMMVTMMDELPARERGVGERVLEVADAIVEPFRFGE